MATLIKYFRKQEEDMDLAWDVNIPPLENSKPKRYIRCEKSLGVSQKWWMCDRNTLFENVVNGTYLFFFNFF